MAASRTAAGSNELKIVRIETNMLEIQLSNTENVAGIQFSLHASKGIVLQSPLFLKDNAWLTSSFQPDDSTFNVFMLDTRSAAAGSLGALMRISFSNTGQNQAGSITLTNVMIINDNADSLAVSTIGLAWNDASVSETTAGHHVRYELEPNYPNPFNPTTTLSYRLLASSAVQLSIFDINGREVERLVDQYQYIGKYHAVWNAARHASGVYIARLTIDHESISQKILLTK
jgi:hypothetical protein